MKIRNSTKRFTLYLIGLIILTIVLFLLSIMLGRYSFISIVDLFKHLCNSFGANFSVNPTEVQILKYIRIPRTVAAFLIGGALSISGLVYQNTFNNKLVSPDILGVSSGCCVGAGIAILLGMGSFWISIVAFIFGSIAVSITLFLPKLFKNRSNLTLILSGVIVGALMNSIISIIKYSADKYDKLSEITFWMMGSLSGIVMKDILYVLPIILVCFIILLIMNMRIDVISLGKEEASSLGINYSLNRLIIIICSTLLTAASVSISGNIGWIGLVIPHMARVFVGNNSRHSMPIAIFVGGSFMMLVDLLIRVTSIDEIPISIITGLLGALIYTIILLRKGRSLYE